MKITTKEQDELCDKCCFLSPECFISETGELNCFGDENREEFYRATGFYPLPKEKQTREIDDQDCF